MCIPPPGMEMGQLAKKRGVEREMDGCQVTCHKRNLSKIPNSCGYDLYIEIGGMESPQVATTTTQTNLTPVSRTYPLARMIRR